MTMAKVGRPRKFETVEEMQVAIDAYFDACAARTIEVVTRKGDLITIKRPEPYTVTGLALALDLCRQSLLNYEGDPEFVDTIKKAKERIHHDLERRAYDGEGSTAGVIFGLKNNYHWKDSQEITHPGPQKIIVEYAKDCDADDSKPS